MPGANGEGNQQQLRQEQGSEGATSSWLGLLLTTAGHQQLVPGPARLGVIGFCPCPDSQSQLGSCHILSLREVLGTPLTPHRRAPCLGPQVCVGGPLARTVPGLACLGTATRSRASSGLRRKMGPLRSSLGCPSCRRASGPCSSAGEDLASSACPGGHTAGFPAASTASASGPQQAVVTG